MYDCMNNRVFYLEMFHLQILQPKRAKPNARPIPNMHVSFPLKPLVAACVLSSLIAIALSRLYLAASFKSERLPISQL